MSEYGVLTDYATGEEIRPATRDESMRSGGAVAGGDPKGVFDLDGRMVFVAVDGNDTASGGEGES